MSLVDIEVKFSDELDYVKQSLNNTISAGHEMLNVAHALSERISELHVVVEEQKQAIAALKADAVTLKIEATTSKAEVATLKTEATTSKAEVATLKAEVATSKAEAATSKADTERMRARINVLEKLFEDLRRNSRRWNVSYSTDSYMSTNRSAPLHNLLFD